MRLSRKLLLGGGAGLLMSMATATGQRKGWEPPRRIEVAVDCKSCSPPPMGGPTVAFDKHYTRVHFTYKFGADEICVEYPVFVSYADHDRKVVYELHQSCKRGREVIDFIIGHAPASEVFTGR